MFLMRKHSGQLAECRRKTGASDSQRDKTKGPKSSIVHMEVAGTGQIAALGVDGEAPETLN